MQIMFRSEVDVLEYLLLQYEVFDMLSSQICLDFSGTYGYALS